LLAPGTTAFEDVPEKLVPLTLVKGQDAVLTALRVVHTVGVQALDEVLALRIALAFLANLVARIVTELLLFVHAAHAGTHGHPIDLERRSTGTEVVVSRPVSSSTRAHVGVRIGRGRG
jgi:hypothetical protein